MSVHYEAGRDRWVVAGNAPARRAAERTRDLAQAEMALALPVFPHAAYLVVARDDRVVLRRDLRWLSERSRSFSRLVDGRLAIARPVPAARSRCDEPRRAARLVNQRRRLARKRATIGVDR